MKRPRTATLVISALDGIPKVLEGDDLAAHILQAIISTDFTLQSNDVIVLAQKIVSKAEGRKVFLTDVSPSPRARELAQAADKDPRLMELILSESSEVLRVRPGIVIVRHKLGFVMANAGIDQSNLGPHGEGAALLLPVDPDASCARLRQALIERTGLVLSTMIIDSVGRAWRIGTIGMAIGISGTYGVLDLRGQPDLFGRPLQASEIGLADEIAAAASLVMGQADEGRPVAIVRGLPYPGGDGKASDLLRPKTSDMFL